MDDDLIQNFERFVAADAFPCVGAKAALNRDQMTFLVQDDLRCRPHDSTVRSIQEFSQRYHADSPLFLSLVVLFRQPEGLTEESFEKYLWRYLQRMHELDARKYSWDATVSQDSNSDDFSFSIGERAYYVVGLHPGASRAARRFAYPALVFNLHDQFERLRADGRYDGIRDTIVTRDTEVEGTQNPMLEKFGTSSEARQYSGRAVDDQWKCPFHAH